MLICDNGVIREMTEEEMEISNNMPDMDEIATSDEILNIIFGGAE